MASQWEETSNTGTQRLFVIPHPVLEIDLGHGGPSDGNGAPMGADVDTEDLERPVLGLRIGPIQGEIDGACGSDHGRYQVAAGDL